MAKGYKLTASSGDGPKTCAFFFSDKGCRSGATCKFSHEQPVAVCTKASSTSPPSVCSSSVVSSESESDGEIVENSAGAYASLGRNEVDIRHNDVNANPNPFMTAVSAPPAPVPVAVAMPAVPEPQQAQPSVEKKKRKRKKSVTPADVAPGESIFDLPETLSPNKNQTNGAVAAPPKSVAAAVATPSTKKAKKAVASPKQTPTHVNTAPPNFRNLQLPIASFSMPAVTASTTTATAAATTPKSSPKRSTSPQHDPAPLPPPMPLPTATQGHLKWKNAVFVTQNHANYANAFNYDRAQQSEFSSGISTPKDWITCRPYGQWCAANPAAIAIDCEMCETKDPVTGKRDDKALCRISVVNADNPSEVLLDTLVKPQWPVTNHRTWINGIGAADLGKVEFTLQHAQTFMAAVCSDQTVIVGHALHNDLLALRMVHHCNADTAMLFVHNDDNDGTPSLKNLAHGVMKKEMPDVHDSVNDARTALSCAQHYVSNNGKVERIEKVYSRSSSRVKMDPADTAMLLVHRLPTTTMPNHITEMFLAYTSIKPKLVSELVFSGTTGKCNVEFTTKEHAELAYMSLVGEEREDKGGKKQKRVGLKGGGYVCVRKMKKGK